MSWQLAAVISGLVGLVDGRFGFVALAICGLIGLLA
jgi:hypothetical protein